jgi:hypothetical protein
MEDHSVTELRKVFPKITPRIGTALWCAFTGGYPEGTYRNVNLPAGDLIQGTWNYWNKVIQEVYGKKNKKSFKRNVAQANVRSVEKKLKKAGWKFADSGIKLDSADKLLNDVMVQMKKLEK